MDELLRAGIPKETAHYLINPNFGEEQLKSWFGFETENAKAKYFEQLQGSPGRYVLREEYRSENAIISLSEEQPIKDALLNAYWDRVFVPSSTDEVLYPYWYWYNAPVLFTLPEHEINKIKGIIKANESSQEDLWRKNGHKLLSVLAKETDMLVCAEDLGAVPACVPGVLQELGILSLRVERWTRDWKLEGQPYTPLMEYPMLSVCATSNHDSSTLLGLWNERDFNRNLYWQHIGQSGSPPDVLTAEHMKLIVKNILQANSLLAILPIQDFMALSQKYISKNPEEDRVNTPGTIGPQNWSWRMACELEDLLKNTKLCNSIAELAKLRKWQSKAAIAWPV
jgi:4-alpha-glucanotransferase